MSHYHDDWKRPPKDEFAEDRRWLQQHPDEPYDFEVPTINFRDEKPWLKVWRENRVKEKGE